MLNIEEFAAKLDELKWIDLRILEVSILHFGEEVRIRLDYEDDEDGVVTFFGCERVKTHHFWTHTRFAPNKELSFAQLDHFFQSANIETVTVEVNEYYKVTMNLFPMEIVVYCRDVKSEIVKNAARGSDKERFRELPDGYTY